MVLMKIVAITVHITDKYKDWISFIKSVPVFHHVLLVYFCGFEFHG